MLRDGCYLHLPFKDYIAQRAFDRLGSTDKSKLWLRQQGWWWGSRHNPFLTPRKSSEEQLFGEATHAVLLEGLHAYETRFVVEPSKRDYPEVLTSIAQIKAALKEAGFYPPRSSDFTKEDWAETAEAYLPDKPVWDNVVADFHRRLGRGDRAALTAEADYEIRAMHALATGPYSTDELRELLSVGSEYPILAEVSYFWTDEDGIRHSSRFDKLLPGSTPELKTLGNWTGRPLHEYIDRHIKRLGYDVQAADHQVSRQHMMRAIVEDETIIHGGTEEERDHLVAVAHYDQEHKPSIGWIFFQKPSAGGSAPVLFPVVEPWKGPYHLAGFRKRSAALQIYRDSMAMFGPDQPWGRVEATHTTVEGKSAPQIMLDPYEFGPDNAAAGEEEHFE